MTDPLDDLIEKLDRLDGREVNVAIIRGGQDPDIRDLTDRVSREIAKNLRREGLL